MKKIIPILLTAVLVFSLFSGCTAVGSTKNIKIGFAAPDADHGWLAGVAYYAKKYCEEQRISYHILTSCDAADMKDDINELVEWGANVIVTWPQWQGMESAINTIIDIGIPVVSFDIDIASKGIYKITGNNYDIGYKCAEYIVGKVGEAASVAVLDVPSAGSVSSLRKQGFYDYLSEIGYDDSRIFEVDCSGFTEKAGKDGMKKALTQHESIDAVFSLDDETSMGAIEAITEAGRSDIKALTGGGGMQKYFGMIADAKYDSLGLCSALYSPSMVTEAIKTAIDLARGEKSMKVIVIPTSIVDKNNVSLYIDPLNTVY